MATKSKRLPKTSTAKRRAWEACSKYIRTKHAVNGMCRCVTCGSWQPIQETDCGHFVPKKRGNAVYFVEENLAPQCASCNRFYEGNTHMFTLYIIDTYGREKVEELEQLARTKVFYRAQDYLDIERRFKEALNELEKQC